MTVLQDYSASVTQPTLTGGPARYDEVVAPDGGLRAAWKGLAESAIRLTDADLVRVSGDIERFLADDGVTYTPPEESSGPWRLDPLPLVLDADEWATLEIGLAQRTELLNAICPGTVDTPLVAAVANSFPTDLDPRLADRLMGFLPGRSTTPAEIGSAIVYLASPAARMITGAVLAFDGGMS